MSVPGFLFGGNTGVTPDKLKRDRAVAEAMLAGASRAGAPRNVGEGLNAIGQALMYRVAKGRADKGGEVEAQKREGIWRDLQAGFGATGMLGVTAPQAASAGVSGTPATSASASLPKGELATYIRDGLTSRGLPGHVADGFMANFQDESGLNPGINEHKPLVPGSRGGFGLFQSTGPRRRALEGVAASRGVPASDVDTQLDVLAAELGLPGTGLDDQPWFGSEGRAAQRIMGSRDTAGAAQAIVNDFLRPAPEHRASRTARYARLGDTAAQIGVAHDPSRPYAPTQVDPEQIARTMQGTQVASLDPSIGMSGLSAKDTAVGQALGLAPSLEPARLSPAAAALNGIASAPQALPPEQSMPQTAPRPAQYAQASMPTMGGPNPQMLMGILADPWASEEQRSVAQFLMQQQMSQQQTAQERAYEAQQLQEQRRYDAGLRQEGYAREDQRFAIDDRREDMRLGLDLRKFERDASAPIEVGGVLLDPNTMQPVYQAPAEPFTLNPGQARFDGAGNQIAAGAPEAPSLPTGVQEYQFAVSQGYPGTFAEWEQSNRRAGATTINTGDPTGGSGKFYENLDKANADMFGTLLSSAPNAQTNLARIDRLEGMLGELGSGWSNSATLIAGNLGIDLGNASGVQAAQALINSMVPEQRAPGSGPMSDADLELFKQSLPRIINSPDGNRRIVETLRGVSQYQLSQADIAARVASREISPEQGNQLLRNLPNPVAWLREAELPTPISAPIDGQGIPTITSKEAFDALPSGAFFMAPDGQKRQKP